MEDLYQQFVGIIVVLSALIAMLWFARKRGFAHFNIGKTSSERMLKVVERVPLTAQHTLFVVAIGSRTMVLSSSPGSCQVISELNAEATR